MNTKLNYVNTKIENIRVIKGTNFNYFSEEGKKIFLINDALRRLENGTYGKCIDCGNQIQSGRLDAIPYAKLCLKCKAVREENELDGHVSFGIDKEEELTE